MGIEDVVEPCSLLQLGFLNRSPRGRILTHHAFKHLGLAVPRKRAEITQGVLPLEGGGMNLDQAALRGSQVLAPQGEGQLDYLILRCPPFAGLGGCATC